MPCNSDYMNPTDAEKNASTMFCLLDELDGKKVSKTYLGGFHPKAYGRNCSKEVLDNLAATLCGRLQGLDVAKYSLELQMWWRDHQEADKARLEREIEEKKQAKEREAALAKLTPYERKLLGLKK